MRGKQAATRRRTALRLAGMATELGVDHETAVRIAKWVAREKAVSYRIGYNAAARKQE